MPTFHSLALVFSSLLWALACPAGELLVYFHDDGSPAAKQFAAETLPFVEALAKTEDLTLTRIDPTEGAPVEISISPIIVFQNHLGRSVYQGRTTTPERIRTLVETARWVPQSEALLEREGVVARTFGRSTVASPIKVAPVSGKTPRGYDEATFQREAREAIAKGLRDSKLVDRLEQNRSERAFYMDFYPWVSDKGKLYLSYALFSQFHCKKPVFLSAEEDKMVGSWRKRKSLFEKAAARLEQEVEKQLTRDLGDGFMPLPADTPAIAWPELPAAPADAATSTNTVGPLARTWVAAENPDGPPPILFQFPAPIDQYRGKVTGVRAELSLNEDLDLSSLTGFIAAKASTVDMGESDLNDALQGSSFLKTKAFPEARFEIEKVESDVELAYGRLATVTLHGTFELKGKKIPLVVVGDAEALASAAGPRLRLRSAWSLDFKGFSIEQADGPSPQRHTLNFDLHLMLQPTT